MKNVIKNARDAATKAGSDIITGVSTHVFPFVARQRLSICLDCEFRKSSITDVNGVCSVCSCPLENKTKVDMAGGIFKNECPKGFW